jgi:exodeoxyribonuclease VII large subunit
MANKLRDRLPVRALLYPAQVQGAAAAGEVAAGVKYFNSCADKIDVIIVARGGGALEDLLPFSEEIVVRAVAESKIPVIAGVGHEPDWMLVDFAADVRAPTPTGAAEIVVPTKASLADALEKTGAALRGGFSARLNSATQRLDDMRIKSPMQTVADARVRVADQFHLIGLHMRNRIAGIADRLSHFSQMLESLSYRNVLRRGYAIVRHNGAIVSNAADFAPPATIEFFDGIVGI